MSKAKTDFEVFKEEFTYWQARFGLTGYRIYFENVPLENKDNYATIDIDEEGRNAVVRLNTDIANELKPHKNCRLTAKHEAIHLLLFYLEWLAKCREVTYDEIDHEVESLVYKLEGLIQ